MKFNYKTVIATAAFVALTSPLMVNASIKSNQAEPSGIAISYFASDLNSASGKAKIESQIRQAAKMVCGAATPERAGSLRVFAQSQNRACYKKSVDKALTSLEGSQGNLVVTAR